MIDTSKTFANAIKNLYIKGVWLVDYAILKAREWADKGIINANDYEELITYLVEEQEKEMQKDLQEEQEIGQVGEQVEEQPESTEDKEVEEVVE